MLPNARQRATGPTPATERVVLTGFMGSGKSTVGPLLAEQLGWTFLDLDGEIESRTGLTVPDLFAQQGEAAFRREETAALAGALIRLNIVIALGGGAPEAAANRVLLAGTAATAVVYLAAPLKRSPPAVPGKPPIPPPPLVLSSPILSRQRSASSSGSLYTKAWLTTGLQHGLTPMSVAAAIAEIVLAGPAGV